MRNVLIAFAIVITVTSCREDTGTPGVAERLHELGANPVWLASCRDNADDVQLDIFSESGNYSLVLTTDGERKSERITACRIVAEEDEGAKHWTEQLLFSGSEAEVIFTLYGGQDISLPFIRAAAGKWGDLTIDMDTTQVYEAYIADFNISYTNLKEDMLHCERTEEQEEDDEDASIDEVAVDSPTIIFSGEDGPQMKQLTVTWLSSDTVEFEIKSENMSTACERTLRGLAVNHYPDGDPEIDEDEEGNAYPAIEYYYEGDCSLSLRIKPDRTLARIMADDCEMKEEEDCPYSTTTILKINR